jgi:hypothetical protein
MLISRFVILTKNLRNSVRKKEESGETLESGLRKCANCGEIKPLDSEHFQVVKSFRSGFSYYCNECNKPKPREE